MFELNYIRLRVNRNILVVVGAFFARGTLVLGAEAGFLGAAALELALEAIVEDGPLRSPANLPLWADSLVAGLAAEVAAVL